MREKAQISFFYKRASEPMSRWARGSQGQCQIFAFGLDQKGASAIEYILLVVVVVSMLLTLTQIFWKPFGNFLDNYVGGYTQCLLEVGELPVLEGQNDVVADLEECRAEFSARIANNPQGQQAGTSQSSSSAERERAQAAERTSRARGNSRALSRMTNSSRGTEISVSSDRKTRQIELSEEDGAGFYRTRNRSSSSLNPGRDRRGAEQRMTFLLSPEEREQLQRQRPQRNPAEATLGTINQPVKKMIVKEPPKPQTQLENEEAFTFTNLIRILIILALLVLIFVLFGAFILQLRQTVRKES